MSEHDDNIIHVNFGQQAAPEPPQPPQRSDEEDVEAALEQDPAAAEKLRIFTDLIADSTVMVTVDARREGVVVPPQFRGDFRLNLNFCHLFGIPDFEYDLHGVRASLSFNRTDIFCDLPWSAIYMLRSHDDNDVVLFPTALPAEMSTLIPEIERAIAEHGKEAEGELEDDEKDEDSGEPGFGLSVVPEDDGDEPQG